MLMTQLTAERYRFGLFKATIQTGRSRVSDYLRRHHKLALIGLRRQTMGIILRVICNLVRPRDTVRLCILLVIALCGIVCLTTSIVLAQELSASDFAPEATTTASGWWSPERTALTVLAPGRQFSVPKLISLDVSEPPSFSTPQPDDGRPAEYVNGPSVNPGGFEFSLVTRSPEFSSLAEVELLSSRSLLSRLQAEYATWESGLADTRSLTSVNGWSVYPLVQVNYADWQLPISLYRPSLRGSDASW
jgi:hypothetical protein